MATRTEAIDLLINKGKFEVQVAVAIAEAVVLVMTEAQFITVPVLDARVADLRGDIVQLDHRIDLVKADLESKIDRFKAELESKITNLDAKIDLFRAELGKLIESTKAEIVRWVLLAMLGSGAIQAAASAFINAVQHR